MFRQSTKLGEGIVKRLSAINLNKSFKNNLNSINIPNLKSINEGIKNQTRMIYTTPQINFNVKEMNEDNLEACFNYINRKFGSKY